jgi:hypothetical protein
MLSLDTGFTGKIRVRGVDVHTGDHSVAMHLSELIFIDMSEGTVPLVPGAMDASDHRDGDNGFNGHAIKVPRFSSATDQFGSVLDQEILTFALVRQSGAGETTQRNKIKFHGGSVKGVLEDHRKTSVIRGEGDADVATSKTGAIADAVDSTDHGRVINEERSIGYNV